MTTETKAETVTITPVRTEVAALFEEARGAFEPSLLSVSRGSEEEASVLVVPKGMNVVDAEPFLEKFRKFPKRPQGTSRHQTLASVIQHARQYKAPGTAAWCELGNASASLLVVYDYHLGNADKAEMSGALEGEDVGARWCAFGASYAFPIAPEFKAWREMSGKELTQEAMAAFLEDHLHEVCTPEDAGERTAAMAQTLGVTIASPSSLLGFARRSAATVSMYVAEKIDAQTGARELIYQEEVNHQTEDRAKIVPPGAFAIRVPVLQGGAEYRLPVRLKSKVSGRAIKWSFEVYRADQAFLRAVEEELAKFTAETGLPVYRGQYLNK